MKFAIWNPILDIWEMPWGGRPLRAIGRVLGDLADLGFDAEWRGIRASELGACHHRFRVFVVAWRRDITELPPMSSQPINPTRSSSTLAMLHTPRSSRGASSTENTDLLFPTPNVGAGTRGSQHPDVKIDRGSQVVLEDVVEHYLPIPNTWDRLPPREGAAYEKAKLHGDGHPRQNSGNLREVVVHDQWGRFASAIESHTRLAGRPAPSPLEPSPRGKSRLSPRFVEWMMCWPDRFVTDPELGLSYPQQLKILGNGVVPPQAVHAIRSCLNAFSEGENK